MHLFDFFLVDGPAKQARATPSRRSGRMIAVVAGRRRWRRGGGLGRQPQMGGGGRRRRRRSQRKGSPSEQDLRRRMLLLLVRVVDVVVVRVAVSQCRKRVAMMIGSIGIAATVGRASSRSHRRRRHLVNVARNGCGPLGRSYGGRRPGEAAAFVVGNDSKLVVVVGVVAHDLSQLVHRFFHQLVRRFDETEGSRFHHGQKRSCSRCTSIRICIRIIRIRTPPLLSASNSGGLQGSPPPRGNHSCLRGSRPLHQRIHLPMKVLLFIIIGGCAAVTVAAAIDSINSCNAVVVGVVDFSFAAIFSETAGIIALLFGLFVFPRFRLAFSHRD